MLSVDAIGSLGARVVSVNQVVFIVGVLEVQWLHQLVGNLVLPVLGRRLETSGVVGIYLY